MLWPTAPRTQRWINNDVYIYERQFFNDVVLVAINKNDTTGYAVSGLKRLCPPQLYRLSRRLDERPIADCHERNWREQSSHQFTLPAHSVAVWQYTSTASAPEVGSIGPTLGQPGVKVTIAGKGFGTSTGSVLSARPPQPLTAGRARRSRLPFRM